MKVHTYEFGQDLIHTARSYDFTIVALFANPETLDRYQTHPHHLPVVKKNQEICDNLATVDFESSNAGSSYIERPSWDFKP